MNEKQIAFIVCVNDEMKYSECRYYLERLKLPQGYEKDIITVTEAPSMAAGYNAGMQSSDAKYKVYLHQDVFIVNRDFICGMLAVFAEDEKIGLLGMVGTGNLSADAYAVASWDCGKISDNCEPLPDFPVPGGMFTEAEAVDGLLLATQYDIPWREDIFDGWDFYDISQCMEFKRAGYKVVVPSQKEAWCCHDNGYNNMEKYEVYRKRFLLEYLEMGDFRIRECCLDVGYDEYQKIYEKVKKLFEMGRMEELRNLFLNPKRQGIRILREYEAIVCIDWTEDKNQSEARFYDGGARPGQMLEKLRVLKYALKRIEYQADDMDESRIFLEKNYSKYAIMDVLSRYVKNKNEVCMKMGHYLADAEGSEQILDWIFKGLKENYKDYAFYYLLGLCLKNRNVNQAFLCMENAEFYCGDEEHKKRIQKERQELMHREGFSVRPVSIVILSYNLKEICIRCIESIRKNNRPDTYEMIVVDNASTDGIYEWLQEQGDIKLIRNEENAGFPKGSNQGIKAAGGNDILLLNNDTEICPNTIFCLRMGLYETGQTGAAGCAANYAGNGQAVDREGYTKEDWRNYARECNVPCKNPYERKAYLAGFALLLRHGIVEQTGMFDERFSPGYYEDNDLGFRIAAAGYTQVLCKNSFALHYGSASFKQRDIEKLLEANKKKLAEKWGFDAEYYGEIRKDMITFIEENEDAPLHILEIGCGYGATLAHIKAHWPKSVVKGVELSGDVAQIGRTLADICQGDIECMDLPYERGYFDYILFGDVLEHLKNPGQTLRRLKPFLKKNGRIIASIPNVMHMSVIVGLLKGTAAYQKSGILDETHLRFFTFKTALELFEKTGFQIEKTKGVLDNRCQAEEEKLIEEILKLPGTAEKETFFISQFLIRAVNTSEG